MNKEQLLTILNDFIEDCISKNKIESLRDFLKDNSYSQNNMRSVSKFLENETTSNRVDSYHIIKRFVSLLTRKLGFNTMIDLHCLKSDFQRVSELISKTEDSFNYDLFETLDLSSDKLRVYMHNLCKKGKVQRIERGLFIKVK